MIGLLRFGGLMEYLAAEVYTKEKRRREQHHRTYRSCDVRQIGTW
ncbi:MAG: hypothetical protein AVDCRST_MAG14-532 [uncultured Rubrobacteraceae bacterium]|uniref:Uncharacterized protein n=1 Tax=uncultured Rubrobacteraceae bacterium TaxID=349277 RepID=A0A6J4QKD1_9ACTN|nr:MAG: hypothetical protein AVDCRST_MAG14-532 [uncultured Rubrobacteraceae bacterium]